jgi:2-dehydro-3-deoxyphosphogluconate aldolase/(4S)-4-hydroxy-2-oxoglutarate aldolase
VRGPLPHIPLVPTNGITSDTVAEYFAAGAVAVGVGGEVFPAGFTLQHVEDSARRIRAAVDRARGLKPARE